MAARAGGGVLASPGQEPVVLAHAALGWTNGRFGGGAIADAQTDLGEGAAALYGWWRAAAGRWDVEVGAFAAYDGLPDTAPQLAIGAGAHAAWHVGPIAVFTGAPWQPAAAGRQLTLVTDARAPKAFELPIGIAVAGRVDAYFEATVISVALAHRDAVVIGQRLGVPIAAGARYHATRVVDIGAEIAGDARDVKHSSLLLVTVGVAR